MRRVFVIASLAAGCGGKSAAPPAPPAQTAPPPTGGTRDVKVVGGVGGATYGGATFGGSTVASADPCEGGELIGTLSTAPAQPAGAGSGAPSGPLQKHEIMQVMRAAAGMVKACYQQALASNPDLKGKVIARFTIGDDGKVTKASASGIEPGVDACIQGVVAKLVFRATGSTSNISFPFVFSSGG